jgi:hypothetical protein
MLSAILLVIFASSLLLREAAAQYTSTYTGKSFASLAYEYRADTRRYWKTVDGATGATDALSRLNATAIGAPALSTRWSVVTKNTHLIVIIIL